MSAPLVPRAGAAAAWWGVRGRDSAADLARRRGPRAVWARSRVRLRAPGGCDGSSSSRVCSGGAARPVAVRRPSGDGRRCSWWWCFHLAALCAGRQGSGLDRGSGVDGVPAAARRRELYGPRRSRPGLCGHGPGMFLLLRPVSYRRDGGGGALLRADGAAALVPAPLLLCADHASRCCGETA